MKLKIKTDLISGAGNTFHIAYDQAAPILAGTDFKSKMKKIAQEVCRRKRADGFIFLEKDNSADLVWYFFNNDGSDAEMCGNASRCVGLVAAANGFNLNKGILLRTLVGAINIKAESENLFRVIMSTPKKVSSKKYFFCDTGVPHLVINYHGPNLFDSLTEEFKSSSRQLRLADEFAPRGTNVTYVENTKDPQRVRAISYERGVEDFTQACGTGALAVAFKNFVENKILKTEVEMPGGVLSMDLTNINEPTMTGPAQKIGSNEYEIEI
jgi:diaminopimelate epimerase